MSWREHDTATSHWVPSSDLGGLRLHVRAHRDDPERQPVLFVHGATYASRLYDIPHPGASWLAHAAMAGFASYALDIRGYGKSHHPGLLTGDTPAVRASDAIRDIDDVVRWLCDRHGVSTVRLVGGSWGSITTAMYAARLGAARVNRLVLYAPIFAERNPGWCDLLADPGDPSRFSAGFGAARLVDEASTRKRWDAEIPAGETWRDEAVFQALVQSSLADDPGHGTFDPPAFRAPNGTFVDLWEAFNARPLYDPGDVRCATLLVRGGADPTSTRNDALALFDSLGATEKSYVEVANGAHFISAERRGPSVFSSVQSFLQQDFPEPARETHARCLSAAMSVKPGAPRGHREGRA